MAVANFDNFEEIFTKNEAKEILKNKYVLFIGDSVIRGMYKDLVKFLQSGDYLLQRELKKKGEMNFENDELLEGGEKNELTNDITYSEVREFKTPYYFVRFYFITRCYSDYFKSICDDICVDWIKPHVVIMNSGCWDITRYGTNSIGEYKRNLPAGLFGLSQVLPRSTLFLWTTTMPVAKNVRGGFMVPEVESCKLHIREDILEANLYAAKVLEQMQLDCLDLHYYFRNQVHYRSEDGIHWNAAAHRRITNLILNHICEMWNLVTPGRQKVIDNPAILEPESRSSDFDEENADPSGNQFVSRAYNSQYNYYDRTPMQQYQQYDQFDQNKINNAFQEYMQVHNLHNYQDMMFQTYFGNNNNHQSVSSNQTNFMQMQIPMNYQFTGNQNYTSNTGLPNNFENNYYQFDDGCGNNRKFKRKREQY